MGNLRTTLLSKISMKTNEDFNNMAHRFMLEFPNANLSEDLDDLKDIKNKTWTLIKDTKRDCNSKGAMGSPALKLVYSVEVVYNVLSSFGWFERMNQGGTSHRKHRGAGTLNASTCTPSSFAPSLKRPLTDLLTHVRGQESDDIDSVELEEQEAERKGPIAIREWEAVFDKGCHATVRLACADRILWKSFDQFVLQYARWWHIMTNATLLRVKLQGEIKAISKNLNLTSTPLRIPP